MLILVVSLLMSACSDNTGKPSLDSEQILQTKNDLQKYTVVFSDSADIELKKAATNLAAMLSEYTGSQIEATDDYLGANQSENEYEILIGKTNREESVVEGLSNKDYTISVVGTKIVVIGGSNPATLLAISEIKGLLTSAPTVFTDAANALTVRGADVSEFYYVKYPISVDRSAEDFSATINNIPAVVPQKINSEYVQINEYDPDWGYRHHARIGRLNGVNYIAWQETPQNEDDIGGRVLMSKSSDFKTWSEPTVILAGTLSESYSTGFFYTYNGTMYFYYNYAEYGSDGKQVNSGLGMYIKTTDGVNWSEPTKGLNYYTGETAPQASFGGRLFICRGLSVLYTDDPTGESGWKQVKLDGSEALENGAYGLNEASFYQTYDGVIHMLIRGSDGYMYHAESYNNGTSWSKIYKTGITDDNAMAYFGRLPDGRIFYIGNPYYSGYSVRGALILAISDDNGQNFSEQYVIRMECDYSMEGYGRAKSGYYGYPEAVIGDDGYMYIVYSKLKEVIEVTRIKLSDIGNDAALTPLKAEETGVFLNFSDSNSCKKVTAVSYANKKTSASYSSAENALKLSGGSAIEISDFLGGKVSAEKYPVLAIRVKKVNYTGKYCGLVYWETSDTPKEKFGSIWYPNDEEYHTMIIDLSEVSSYSSSVKGSDDTNAAAKDIVKSFTGTWEKLYLRFGGAEDLENNSAFYIKWIAVYPSVNDAMNDVILNNHG